MHSMFILNLNLYSLPPPTFSTKILLPVRIFDGSKNVENLRTHIIVFENKRLIKNKYVPRMYITYILGLYRPD